MPTDLDVVSEPATASCVRGPAGPLRERTSGLPRTHSMGVMSLAFKRAMALLLLMSEASISAPAGPFLAGLGKVLGYSVQADGERLAVAFEPWSLEHADPYGIPCLRLGFRQEGERIILESFTVSESGEEQPVSLEAAHDALQAWMDCMAD